ncbi:MAG: energy-coupling factor ABC transporter permease [Acidobacteriota bacterium]
MHIPDGFLTPPVWLTLDVISVPVVAWVARRRPAVVSDLDRRVPLMGVMGAFVFAAQMINFPVGLGASGHLLGGTLLALMLGPGAAAIVLTAVLILQALLFQDGGVLALGANIFNMALAGVLLGYLPSRLFGRNMVTIFLGGMLSVLISGVLALAELQTSGVAITGHPAQVALLLFALTGIVEGAITVVVIRSIERLNHTALRSTSATSLHARLAVIGAAAVLALCGAWLASGAPDSLQLLASNVGLDAEPVWTHSPLANYEVSSLGPEWARRPAAGLLGLAFVYTMFSLGGKKR